MRRIPFLFLILLLLTVPVQAIGTAAPEPPGEAAEYMPENTEDFSAGLREILQNAMAHFYPDLVDGCRVCLSIVASVILISVLKTFTGPMSRLADLTGAAAIAGNLLLTSRSLVQLGAKTVYEINEYGKLLLPVMTGALAAQGGLTKSAALYAGTAGFTALLGMILSHFLIPAIYLFLTFSIGCSALSQESLRKFRDMIKSLVSWGLKTLITVFTSYISLTGIITGTADAAALKATKATVSAVVPVVGGILSGASETMLLSAAMLKNAAGIYGILALLAIGLNPFLRILIHYWLLKLTSMVCSVFGSSNITGLVGDFSSAMGLLLAMTGTSCLLQFIGIFCFMKGVG